MKDHCRLCGGRDLVPLLEMGEHPIAHRFLSSPSDEEYVHPVRIRFCGGCDLIQLVDPIPPEMLYTTYNWLSSWKPQPHMSKLVQLINDLPGLSKTSNILEVGSNDGTFLHLLKEDGYKNLLGIEPAKDAQSAAQDQGIQTLNCYFTPEVAANLVSSYGQYDLFIARQVLEHVDDLRGFRKAVSLLLRPGGYVLIEVPNSDLILDAPDYSLIWEEHVNYFTLETLSRFLAEKDIHIFHSETALFSGEALIAFAQLGEGVTPAPSQESADSSRRRALAYRDQWPVFRENLTKFLGAHKRNGKTVAVYGAGCRAASIINFAGLAPFLSVVFDDQPEKQGKFMPGSRLAILPGDGLAESSTDLCLLAVNAENEHKVIGKHVKYVEDGGQFLSLHPPSPRLVPGWNKF